MLQNGRDRGTAAAQRSRRVVGFVGGAVDGSDGGEAQRSARHPRNVVQAPGLFVASSWSERVVGRVENGDGLISRFEKFFGIYWRFVLGFFSPGVAQGRCG